MNTNEHHDKTIIPHAAPENARLDNQPDAAIIGENTSRPSIVLSLDGYADSDYITKKELCAAFKCGVRTVQRMVERFEIPPPIWLAGRRAWIVGNLREWIARNVERSEAEAAEFAKKMHAFNS